jgi:hypothetical protein
MLGQDAKAEGDLKRAVQFDPSLKTQIEDEVNLIKHRRKTQ